MSHVIPILPPSPFAEPIPELEPTIVPTIGACGLLADPLDAQTTEAWQSELAAPSMPEFVEPGGKVVQAELSGFEDDEEEGIEPVPAADEDDEFDDFDDIDDEDFDDDFDDDFEEELDDDYEIEIEDEISAEFGLSGVVIDDIDEIEDIDVIELDAEIEIEPLDDLDDKEE